MGGVSDLSQVTAGGRKQCDWAPRPPGLEWQQRAGAAGACRSHFILCPVPALAAWIGDVSSVSLSLPRPRGCLSCPTSPQSHAAACPMDFSRGGAVQWLQEQASRVSDSQRASAELPLCACLARSYFPCIYSSLSKHKTGLVFAGLQLIALWGRQNCYFSINM